MIHDSKFYNRPLHAKKRERQWETLKVYLPKMMQGIEAKLDLNIALGCSVPSTDY